MERMESSEATSQLLKDKYNLHKSPEVENAAKRTRMRTGEKVPQAPLVQIQNYLNRLERLVLDPKKDADYPRSLSLLREMVMNKYVRPNKDKMAQGAAIVEERAARELGMDMHYGQEELEQRGGIAVKDMESSLDQWINYLSDPNEPYPTWFRYYTFRNILDLGEYDKDKGEFPKRSAGTNRLFPDIDRGALGYIQDIIEAARDPQNLERLRKAQKETDTPSDQMLTKEKAQNFTNFSFAKQYAEGMKQAGEITSEMRAETRGKWVTYPQNSDPTPLWASLQNKGTAWCTKGYATADTQLKGGDFHVYYTLDKQGNPTIPRIAIRMQEGQVFEARGVLDTDQNIEKNMLDIADQKIDPLPGAEKFRRATSDMKYVTSIEDKVKKGEYLSGADLTFLYELNSAIEGFGYKKDPRIAELRSQRNPQEDMPVVFGCDKSQIAHSVGEINKDTKAYVGALTPGIFDTIQRYNVERVYTSFPEGKIRIESIEIGGKSVSQLERELQQADIHISEYAKDMLRSKDFTTLPNAKMLDTIRLRVADLGLPGNPTTDQVFQRANDLGLDRVPAETGVYYRLKYTNQSLHEWLIMGMKQITVRYRYGYPLVFELGRREDGSWLSGDWARPDDWWDPEDEFMFSLSKSEPQKLGFLDRFLKR